MEPRLPDIYSYFDFRAFLRDAYLRRKGTDPKFSHRYISARIGANSAGWFSDVTGNRMGLKPKYVGRLAAVFGLKGGEAEHFRLLVEWDQADTLKEKSDALERVLADRGLKRRPVGGDQVEFYSEWYHAAIRELLALRPYHGDFAALAKALIPGITPGRARKSVLLLAQLGMIKRSPSGRWVPQAETLIKDTAQKTFHWARIQRAFLELALPAIEAFTKSERDFSALTLSFSPEGFRRAGEEIAALRKRLLALSEQDRRRDRVYQCNFQMFPLSKSLEVENG
jgi:uncharacterized protein (TIGR02147 family)